MTRTRLALAWVVIGLLLAGCGDDASVFSPTTSAAPTTTAVPTTGSAETTTTAVVTTSTAATTTTAEATSTTTTTTSAAVSCSGPGAGPIPAGAEELSSVAAQLDGDGAPDEFSAYRLAGVGYVHARLSSGYATQLALDGPWAAAHFSPGVNYLRVESARTLGSPPQVAVVQLYGGLVAAYGLFAFEDCAIVPLAGPDGFLPDLWVGMGPAHSDWPVCGPGPTVAQVVYGTSDTCADLLTCATPNLSITEYRVLWGPARLEVAGEASRPSTRGEWDGFQSLTCLGP